MPRLLLIAFLLIGVIWKWTEKLSFNQKNNGKIN